MNPFIWCAVGALTGGLAGIVMSAPAMAARIENVLVGVFGAFVGGEFLASFTGAAAPRGGFQASSLGLAIGGSLAALVLLKIVRKAVGPMRPHKTRGKMRP